MCVHVCVNRPSTGASIFEVCVCLCVSTVLVQVRPYACVLEQVRPYACVCPQS